MGFGKFTHWIVLNHRQWSVRSRTHKRLEVARHCHRDQAHGNSARFSYHLVSFFFSPIRVGRRANVFLPSPVLCSGYITVEVGVSFSGAWLPGPPG